MDAETRHIAHSIHFIQTTYFVDINSIFILNAPENNNQRVIVQINTTIILQYFNLDMLRVGESYMTNLEESAFFQSHQLVLSNIIFL